MAPTSTSTRRRTPPLPIAQTRTTGGGAGTFADVLSFGYIIAVIIAVTQFQIELGVPHVLAIIALFGGLRYIAHEIQRDEDAAKLANAKRLAKLRAESPSRWTVEQRDGLGRRVDTGA